MRPRLRAFADLRAFEAAARHLSFREAGDELCVTHSAISHHVKDLERDLGGPLFWRPGRPVELTDAGAMLFPVLCDAFDLRQWLAAEIAADPDLRPDTC